MPVCAAGARRRHDAVTESVSGGLGCVASLQAGWRAKVLGAFAGRSVAFCGLVHAVSVLAAGRLGV